MGKLTINGVFSTAMLVYQRVFKVWDPVTDRLQHMGSGWLGWLGTFESRSAAFYHRTSTRSDFPERLRNPFPPLSLFHTLQNIQETFCSHFYPLHNHSWWE